MKFILIAFALLTSTRAFAKETISFQTSLYGLLCISDGCQITKPLIETVNLELVNEDDKDQPTGFYQQEIGTDAFDMGGHILVAKRDNLYMFFMTSWIQPRGGKPELRQESHVSITVDDLPHMNRINLPSPDIQNGADLGHTQFMIGSQLR